MAHNVHPAHLSAPPAPWPGPGRVYAGSKRAFDVLAAGLLLLALLPALLLLALAVRLDGPGPVLFRQVRVGRGGRPFAMLKFRTMRPDRRAGAGARPPGAPERRRAHKSAADPRVTRVGRVLRRTCLDELPQLWNVLRGDMSLVGPRPELPAIVAAYAPWQHGRHAVRPGLTGWWQVNRDGTQLMHQQTELDLHYVAHRGWALDLLILGRTVAVVLRGTGAF